MTAFVGIKYASRFMTQEGYLCCTNWTFTPSFCNPISYETFLITNNEMNLTGTCPKVRTPNITHLLFY